jgi:hypothetical protein
MTNILALYRGRTVTEAQLVAVTVEPSIVDRFIRELTAESAECPNQYKPSEREALRLVGRDGE